LYKFNALSIVDFLCLNVIDSDELIMISCEN